MDVLTPRFKRIALKEDRLKISFLINGKNYESFVGDTVLTALLANINYLRLSDFNQTPRAGFCLIGACQDCYVELIDGNRVRACTTLLQPNMHFIVGKVDQHE